MTINGRAVMLPVDRGADIHQPEVFCGLLAERRAQLCDRLDEETTRLARYELSRDSFGARFSRQWIREIGTEIREIDRMTHALRVRLLGEPAQQR